MFFTTFLKERLWAIVFLVALAYFVFLIRQDMVQNKRLEKEKAALSRSLDEEKLKNIGLKNRMKVQSSGAYIEEIARVKLGYTRRGETAYKVIVK